MNNLRAGNRSAIVLLSGGMDSAVTLAHARAAGIQCYALTFRYGQRHAVEIEAARRVAQALGATRHTIADIDLRQFGCSALTDNIPVPKNRSFEKMLEADPITYVPARNTIFLALALAFAETLDTRVIFFGANALDHAGYPDCRPEFIRAFERLANVATQSALAGNTINIRAPLIRLARADIVKKGMALGVDFSLTHSCYDPIPKGLACGACDACRLRLRAFSEAGFIDPISYASVPRPLRTQTLSETCVK